MFDTVRVALQGQQVCRVPVHWSKVPTTVQWRAEPRGERCKNRRRCVGIDVQSSPSSIGVAADVLICFLSFCP